MDRPRLLIVDEDPGALALGREILQADFDVEIASDGLTGWTRLRREGIDVVLVDAGVLGPARHNCAAAIRSAGVDVEVVLSSAPGLFEAVGAGVRAGAFDCIAKPFTVLALSGVVWRAVQHRRAWREAARVRRTVESRFGMGAVVGTSAAMQPVFSAIQHASADDAPFVVIGERGSGR
jgi:DNA-binding NtrC family response regulator